MKLARSSRRWVLGPLLAAFILTPAKIWPLLGVALALAALMAFFHRDPERAPPEEGMVSPADGLVVEATDEDVAIFMSHLNVHVNRSPLEGRVAKIEHSGGGHRPAFLRSSSKNERNLIVLDTPDGELRLRQITGFFVRRIVCYVRPGDLVERGERIGMIRFGSRVEFSIPDGYALRVAVGDRVRAGETIVAVKKR
ncbi:MAG: phosphatidylserine decarboxylase [Methanothrix sp.]|jgi:phosphatidylserine decarboxylase|uniref:Putative archaetidylserine decarboxylase proenzyme n=1 Tax=Methanothrix harundinacea TaxID=301375 RepID=A0A101FSA2_9EURY|nr:MAG: phosphatidylserine decarboxylase [Methanosaeta sp. SDB]KUK43515.1 MAG: Phosphatidylserine decarboxylase-like protein [Methanothrix harundinacea]MDD2637986.1 phosphatidylserine decarboxylase [Methanothrix sp.]MDI9400297.1 phosphatidylserine decarboxylase [Euryarchaeota archaeon]KUK94354.1 MAG: Phosphatidylserine decarboxylase-like protein [Methanothrix harundinacea]